MNWKFAIALLLIAFLGGLAFRYAVSKAEERGRIAAEEKMLIEQEREAAIVAAEHASAFEQQAALYRAELDSLQEKLNANRTRIRRAHPLRSPGVNELRARYTDLGYTGAVPPD